MEPFLPKQAVMKMPCTLNEIFPFDTQTCRMVFGSWVYSSQFVTLIRYINEDPQIDVLDSFSHTEWEIRELTVELHVEERTGHLDEEFNELEYNISLSRFPHYYKLSMGMTIALVLVSFIIMGTINVGMALLYLFRHYLALRHLQIRYRLGYLHLDNFFLCCFIIYMLVSLKADLFINNN